jgi:hypothetical protein
MFLKGLPMALRRKDGSEYRLRGPNRLLVRQNFWHDDEPIRVRNFDQLARVTIDVDAPQRTPSHPPVSPPPSRGVDRIIETIDEISSVVLEETLPEPPKPAPPPKLEQKAVTNEPVVPSNFRHLDRHLLYCLPANLTTYKDELYGDEVRRLEYDSPFRFQGTVASSSDANMIYWTTVEHVTERSIIYHSSRYRWWKVSKILPDPTGDGMILQCTPSELKPDFTQTSS